MWDQQEQEPERPRGNPGEWHSFGLLAPAELDALVDARLRGDPDAASAALASSDDLLSPDEPTYGDFLRKPTA
ncbi:hypothetical protein GCM10017714_17400 [Curtobacterium pusillum]|uniref:Uncharacterized protein n=1 Tax=Curtobacterium pusillum TaxID=69373 RepID=A0ABX2M8N8_9MICO|nr:hypothetical protein [Curtobacterium pusillum]NUU14417.1 hypothetical protein [Curtobacterium pusillum]GLK30999.1 hypothetical protein GCM10017610_12840 [Curtobacterium pusillum]